MKFPPTLRGEKAAAKHQSPYESETSSDVARNGYDEDLHVPALSDTTEAKLMRKIDLRVIPCLCVLYLLAFLDRVNIANAAVFNLKKDLSLTTGQRYNNCLVIFFIPYILLEIPSNLLLKRFKPHVWLSGCMFLFGLVSICQGLVSGYGGLLAARFFLGVAECGMFPGCFYLISMWYKRSEAQRRYSFFFSSTTLAGAFGGLLASAIGKMQGLRGYSGWRWIFILEGVLTCVVAIASFWVLPDFPEDAKWLTPEERAYVKARLAADQGEAALERKTTLKDVGTAFKDFKLVIGGFMYFGLIVPAYGYAYFAPSIIQSYGYSPIQTQLHSVPPWACAFAFCMIVAIASDKLRHRFAFTLISIAVSISGFAMLLGTYPHKKAEYAALFLVTCGTYTAMPVVVCWFQMNLGGHHRRSIGTGWQVGFGNIGGIIAVYCFQTRDAPRYRPGYGVCIAFACLSAVSCTAYWMACTMQNRKREKGGGRSVEGLTEAEKTELGDLRGDYRYQL